jgi:hypothetical protein
MTLTQHSALFTSYRFSLTPFFSATLGLTFHFILRTGIKRQTDRKMADIPAPELLRLLQTRFNRQELELLLFNLGIDHDKLTAPEASRDKLAQEAVAYYARRQQLPDLQAAILKERPELAAELGQSGGQITITPTRPHPHWWLWGMGGILLLTLLIATGILYFTPAPPFNLTISTQDAQTLAPLPNTSVLLIVGGNYTPFPVYTDTNGVAQWTLPSHLANQPAQLEVRQTGYEPYQRNLTLDSATINNPITVRLTPLP